MHRSASETTAVLVPAPSEEDADGTARRRMRRLTLAATVFVAVVGAYGISVRGGLSIDEGWSVGISARPLPGVLHVLLGRERNMALFFLVLHWWAQVSTDPHWLCVLPLVFAVLAVPAVAWAGTQIGGRQVGALAALLTAVNSSFLSYAINLRGYTLDVLLAALCVGSAVVLWRTARPRWAVGLVAGGVALTATTLLSWLLFAALGLVVLVRRDGHRRPVLLALAVLAVLAGPFDVWALVTDRGNVDWIPAPTLRSVGEVALFLCGSKLGLVVMAGALVLFLVVLRREGTSGQWLVLAWIVVPAVVLLGISLVKPLLIPRYLMFTLPAFGLMIAFVLRGRRHAVPLTLLVAGALAVAGLVRPWTAQESDLNAASSWILRSQQPADAVVYAPAATRAWFGHYLGDWASTAPRPHDLALAAGGSPLARGDTYGREVSPAEVERRAAAVPRLWVVSYADWPSRTLTPEPFEAVEGQVLAGRPVLARRSFGEAVVTLYGRP